MKLVRFVAVGVLLGLVACTPRPADPQENLSVQRKRLVGQGHSTVYAEGYSDGCSSAKNAGGIDGYSFRKNHELYQQNKDYGLAWRQGYRACRVGGDADGQDKYLTTDKMRKIWSELKK